MNYVLVPMAGVKAPTPMMHRDAAERYNRLREIVREKSGVDFLSRCGEMLRAANFVSSKDGVANRSWHKTGRAFDYDQESSALVIVSEPRNGKQYFRTYLKCARQDGSLGVKRAVQDKRGFTVNAYLFDFTEAAEAVGFHRIPAWSGWQSHYNRQEFWHYQFDQGLTWDAAMLQLQGKDRPAADMVLGVNDRGEDVRIVQSKLADLNFLPKTEVDGVFGAKTKAAVVAYQKAKGLAADGIVGSQTRAKLFS